MNILVVEDDSMSRYILIKALRKLGHEAVEAADGQEAWRLFHEGEVHAVITDWMMPNKDGLELCRLIRSEHSPKYTYIIMLTVLGGKESYLEAMEAGADDFVTKPFDIDQLRARLRVAERILMLQDEVKQLNGLLPICANCKKIRDDKGYWTQVEGFIMAHTEATFTHGVCPECAEKFYGEFLKKKKAE